MKKIVFIALTICISLNSFAQNRGFGRLDRPPIRDLGRPYDMPPIDEARRAKIEMFKVQFITEKLNLTKSEAEFFGQYIMRQKII